MHEATKAKAFLGLESLPTFVAKIARSQMVLALIIEGLAPVIITKAIIIKEITRKEILRGKFSVSLTIRPTIIVT